MVTLYGAIVTYDKPDRYSEKGEGFDFATVPREAQDGGSVSRFRIYECHIRKFPTFFPALAGRCRRRNFPTQLIRPEHGAKSYINVIPYIE